MNKKVLSFKRHGSLNFFEIRGGAFYIELSEYKNHSIKWYLSITYKRDNKTEILYNEQIMQEMTIEQVLRYVKPIIENKLIELGHDIDLNISYIESYYIACGKGEDEDVEDCIFNDGAEKKILIPKNITVKELKNMGIDLKATLSKIYKYSFEEIKNIFDNVDEDMDLRKLWKFIHDTNYKKDFKEQFLKLCK